LNPIVKLLTGRKRSADRFWELAQDHVKFLYNMARHYAGNQFLFSTGPKSIYLSKLINFGKYLTT
jgi:hypothetical protein